MSSCCAPSWLGRCPSWMVYHFQLIAMDARTPHPCSCCSSIYVQSVASRCGTLWAESVAPSFVALLFLWCMRHACQMQIFERSLLLIGHLFAWILHTHRLGKSFRFLLIVHQFSASWYQWLRFVAYASGSVGLWHRPFYWFLRRTCCERFLEWAFLMLWGRTKKTI